MCNDFSSMFSEFLLMCSEFFLFLHFCHDRCFEICYAVCLFSILNFVLIQVLVVTRVGHRKNRPWFINKMINALLKFMISLP